MTTTTLTDTQNERVDELCEDYLLRWTYPSIATASLREIIVATMERHGRTPSVLDVRNIVCDCGGSFTKAMRLARNKPAVGDGATIHHYSDSTPQTVIAVSANGKTITLQRDKATLLNGFNSGEPDALTFTPGGFFGHTEGVQRYSYERDLDGPTTKATLRKDGTWRVSRSTERVTIGARHKYYDYNF